MRNQGIALRMILVVGASVVITVAAVLGLSYLLRVSAGSAQSVAAAAREQTQHSFELLDLAVKVQGTTQKLVQETDPDVMESLIEKNKAQVKDAQAKVEQVAAGDDGVKSAFLALVKANEQVTKLVLQARNAESHQAIIEKSNPAFEALLGAINHYQNQMAKRLGDDAAAVRTRSVRLESTIFALVVAGIVLLVVWGVALVRSVSRALHSMIYMVKDLAEGEGDLTKRLGIVTHDELGELAKWFNTFLDKIHGIISNVAGTAEQVASASEELSSSATLQAQGADHQKDQAAQVATAMQEMSCTVQQVSENCSKAADASRRAAETARAGGAVVEKALTQMHSIAESVAGTAKEIGELGHRTDQIGHIAGVIDDIADQTNLLALNAAIEAARAGEQGRGFAVVADEVRKLAERTTTATKEISQMISVIQDGTKAAVKAMDIGSQQVEAGVASTARAGESLQQIIHMSEEVGSMITHIATAATEQSGATGDVNQSMDQIAHLVKESAVAAQQSAKACQDLSELALALQSMVGSFKLQAASEEILPAEGSAPPKALAASAF
ncbi:MAG: methyl-accepting chemotaxis protein [Candidatus Sulfotelmatobacter sp.]